MTEPDGAKLEGILNLLSARLTVVETLALLALPQMNRHEVVADLLRGLRQGHHLPADDPDALEGAMRHLPHLLRVVHDIEKRLWPQGKAPEGL